MYLGKYEEIIGITISEDEKTKYSAACARARRNLESLLGYTLDKTLVDNNQYAESGIAPVDSIYFIDDSEIVLSGADAVIKAYRLFSYNAKDDYLKIDPCTAIHKVKLVKNNITYRSFTTQEYRGEVKNNVIKYIELYKYRFFICNYCQPLLYCHHLQGFQLAVDADWLWSDDNYPYDLLAVWADMVTYLTNDKKHLKAENIGGHSYTQYDTAFILPETIAANMAIIKKYAGGNGTSNQMPVI